MNSIMQHCFGKDNSGGPVKAFHRLIKYSSFKFSVIRQLDGAGGLDIELIRKFVKEIKKEKPTLIHIRGLGNEGFHAALAAKISGVPNILVSIHGTHRDLVNDFHPIKKWIVVNVLERFTLNIATDIVTVCDYAHKRSFLYPYKHKLRNPISNGVPIPNLLHKDRITELRKQLGISQKEIVGICVSRITLEKGYSILAASLKKIDNEENKFTLLIIGGGDEDGSIRAFYSELNYIKVRFIGHVKNVDEYLSISNFFIFPTLHENLSNALIEAMSYQLPVIATSVGGNVEVIKKGGGILINSNNIDDLSLSIEKFVNNPDYISKLGFQARDNIINNYSITKIVQSWDDLYSDIVKNKMNKRKVIFLGFTIPAKIADDYFKLDPSPAIQTHKFAWSFARSLAFYNQVFLVSSIPIQNYPLVDKIFIKGGVFHSQGFKGYYIPFINILLVKHVSRLISGFFILLYLCIFKKSQVIFVHGIHTPYLILASFFRIFGIKVAIVLTDPAGVELSTDSVLSIFLKRMDRYVVCYFTKRASFLIALAPKLIEISNKKLATLVFPGILNKGFEDKINSLNILKKENRKEFIIIYAGGLHEIYGIKILVNAILSFNKNYNIKMVFFGKGDQLDYIKKVSAYDSRIEYSGFLSDNELIPQLLNADLLINPRPTSSDFASLSFPSKLIEYLATGVPVLTTRIDSIPLEYEGFFYYIEDETEIGIQEAIIAVLKKPTIEKFSKALKAKQFIEKDASEKAIAEKINYMVTKLLDC